MNFNNTKNIVEELTEFLDELKKCHEMQYLASTHKATTKQISQLIDLKESLLEKAGGFRDLITELSNKEKITVRHAGKELYTYDIWFRGLGAQTKKDTLMAQEHCIDATVAATGRIKQDINAGLRDLSGNLIKSDEIEKKEPVVKPLGKKEKDESHLNKLTLKDSVFCWESIKANYGVSKMQFGKKIRFVSDPLKRKIIFRDIEQASTLASQGFAKPAVILAGGVIEELLRLYLEHQNIRPINDTFDGYIKTCEQEHLLKNSVSRLSDALRQFRNLVHIDAEKTSRYSISKATAVGAVSSIFTIANDF